MTKNLFILMALVSTIIACKNKQEKLTQEVYNPCINGHDTTFRISFSKDTTTKDFYQLLDFIESKGEFSRFDKKHKIDTSIGNSLLLQKVLCEDKGFDTPLENWILDNIFSIRYYMTSSKSIKGKNYYFPKFDLTQFNFKTEEEKNKAFLKIKEIGWGDPLKKWNDYYIVTSKTRIIVLQSGAKIFSETKNRYGKMIQEEWVDKNSH